ncbi:polyketide synthase dehydratase domain-containing protein, partial [Streptomyces sp. NPDC058103]
VAGVDGRFVTHLCRRDDDSPSRLLTGLATGFVHGMDVDWGRLLPGARTVPLPTYAFQHERFWLAGNRAESERDRAGHRLLHTLVEVADGDGLVLAGAVGMRSHSWLADHAMLGRVLLPATGFAELALFAGDRVGCARLVELTLQTSLQLPPQGQVQLQVVVGGPDETAEGVRDVSIHSRLSPDEAWRCHARGRLAPQHTEDESTAKPGPDAGVWPPNGAVPVAVDGVYERLATAGQAYGPVFAGVRAVWRRDDDVFADVVLSPEEPTDGFLVHPALVDAAAHPLQFAAAENADPEEVSLPFVFAGMQVYATGARKIRVRVSRTGEHSFSMIGTDPSGARVFEVERIGTSAVQPGQLADASHDGRELFHLDWTTVSDIGGGQQAVGWSVLDLADGTGLAGSVEQVCAGAGAGGGEALCVVAGAAGDVVSGVRGLVADVLGVVQRWLAGELNGKSLVVVTRGAVAVNAGERPADLAGAAVWGLVRSVQVEHPGRVVLVDVDDDPASLVLLGGLVAAGYSQVAVRLGRVWVPRLRRVAGGRVVEAPSGWGT